MEYNVKRDFTHKTHGAIGAVHLVAQVDKVTVDGKELPGKSVEYLLNFALQSLQDAYAGAKTVAEAKSMFDKRLENVIAGTIGQRIGGGGQSEEVRVAIQITKAILKAKLTEDAFAKYKDSDEEVLAAFEKNRGKLQPLVDARLKELAKERERKAKLAASAGELDL